MKINIIVAIGNNGVIGLDGKMPWHIPTDLRYFKERTIGHTVIMGRKTFESLHCQPLSKRENIVLTSSNHWDFNAGFKTARHLRSALQLAINNEVFIIGGAQVYEEAFKIADVLYLTRIIKDFEGDTYLKGFNPEEWTLDEKRGPYYDGGVLEFYFEKYIRK